MENMENKDAELKMELPKQTAPLIGATQNLVTSQTGSRNHSRADAPHLCLGARAFGHCQGLCI